MQLTGSEIVIECLKEQGVDTVFGYPGGTILNIYDELYKHSDEIHHILTSHEQGAAHAADGYARSTGKAVGCRLFIRINRSHRSYVGQKIADSNQSNEAISTDSMLPWQHDSSLSLMSPRP